MIDLGALDLRLKALINEAMHKYLGVSVDEIKSDITDTLLRNPLFDFEVDIFVSFKKAKVLFKKFYIEKILRVAFGNISEASILLVVSRENLQRLTKKLRIGVEKFRNEVINPEYIKEIEVKGVIEKTLESYKSSLNPERYKTLYQNVPLLSKDIVKQLPSQFLTLKQAEKEFEKKYFKKALEFNKNNISRTAKFVGLRFETLHRKLKELFNN